MRLVKLAARMVVAWRGSVYAAVAATVAVTAIATLAASVVGPIRLAVTERYRLRFEGELAARLPAHEAERVAREAEAAGARVSLAVRGEATLDSDGDLLLVRLALVDLPAELAFRGLAHVVEPEVLEAASPNDAVLLSRSGDGTARAVGRVATPNADRLARIAGSAPAGPRGAELLVHDPAALAPGATDGGAVDVRVRGIGGRLTRRAREALVARTPLEPTGWREAARAVLAPVSRGLVLLVGILASLAVGTLLPGQLLLLRRAGESLQLLRAWGFPRRAVARLVTLAGAIGAGAAGAAGAGIALAAAAVLNAQGRPASSLLPAGTAVDLSPVLAADTASADTAAAGTTAAQAAGTAVAAAASQPPSALIATVTPSVGWALACVAIATLLGAVTALPSARIAATLDGRRDVWHW